ADGPRARVAALARAYLDFAERNPAVYDAMFQLDGGLAFANEDTPEPLKDGFAALLETLAEVAGEGIQPGLFTETFWAALHGLATLTRAGRLPTGDAERRVELFVDRLATV
ncbi:TetR-like C-terminal domain-containing protein, partial [Streptomyces sp. NPDC048604]|uniref:TetR-like C-terminal domain-containing protein n=1 Tax=Streptomyces sp. NPDC048604 TaxID=3365578 RepID=UPI00371C5436